MNKSVNPLLARLLGLFFRLLYHPLAWSYDAVAAVVSVGRWRNWVLSAARQVSGRRVLELGFGPGHLQTHLSAAGIQVFGLDESASMARQARKKLARGGQEHGLVRGLAQNLPFQSNSFDSVVSTFPTPYIIHPATLAEVHRVLAEGGRLVVLFAAWINGSSLLDQGAALLFRVTGQAPAEFEAGDALLAPFREAGFQVEARRVNLPDSTLLYIIAIKVPGTNL